MILKVALSLLVFTLLEEISIEGAECLPDLKNTAVYEGDHNSIMNLTADPNNVKWTIIPTSDEFGSYTISDFGGYRDPSLTRLFYLNQSGLVILDATTTPNGLPISTSGLYIAQCANNDNRTGAKLVVVRGPPVCSCNASSPDAVQLSCSIIDADGTIHPIYANMTWTNGGLTYTTETPPRTRIDEFGFESTSTITVDNSVPATFTCTVTFNAPVDIEYPFIATNAPEFSASCSVAVCTITNSQTTTITPPITDTSPTTTEILTTTSSPTTVSSYCYPNMKNIAVREGTLDVPMNVTASLCTVKWTVLSASDEAEANRITSFNCTVDPTLTNLYYVNRSGLIIQNSTTTENGQPISTAGLYIADCNNNGNRKGAKLLVVRSGPECSCIPDSSSSNVQLSCTVVYADSSTHPIPAVMTWVINGAYYTEDRPYMNKTAYYVFTAISTITVDVVVNSYQCILTFGTPTEITYDWIVTNAPEFNESCSTPCTIGPCTAQLENVAVYEGDLSILIYYPSSPNGVKWSTLATTEELALVDIVNYDDTVNASYAADYAFDSSSGLTVKNATINTAEPDHHLSTAGLYTVECGSSNSFNVKVLVVRSGPTCSRVLPDAATIQVTCSAIYADSTYDPIAAIFTLYVDGSPISPSETPQRTNNDPYTFISSFTFTTAYSSSSTYECGLTFGQPTEIQDPNIAMNAPTFNQKCTA